MQCRYTWEISHRGGVQLVQCEILEEDHELSHTYGTYSVARKRENSYKHYWIEHNEEKKTIQDKGGRPPWEVNIFQG